VRAGEGFEARFDAPEQDIGFYDSNEMFYSNTVPAFVANHGPECSRMERDPLAFPDSYEQAQFGRVHLLSDSALLETLPVPIRQPPYCGSRAHLSPEHPSGWHSSSTVEMLASASAETAGVSAKALMYSMERPVPSENQPTYFGCSHVQLSPDSEYPSTEYTSTWSDSAEAETSASHSPSTEHASVSTDSIGYSMERME
jgi:hypothetical protein